MVAGKAVRVPEYLSADGRRLTQMDAGEGIFHRKGFFKGVKKKKMHVFFPGILPAKNTVLHPPIGGSGWC